MEKTLEQRIAQLETELATLRGKPVVYANAYGVASQNCKAYFEGVKLDTQTYAARMQCESAARSAFREKHQPDNKGREVPAHYIRTEEEGAEYFALFKDFLAVYQNYLNPNHEAIKAPSGVGERR